MATLVRLGIVLTLAAATSGCLWSSNHRDNSFQQIKNPPRVLLLLVGGNSECSGSNGLWPIRQKIADDLALHLGIERNSLSTDYVAWTGDPGDHPGCLPGNAQYLSGHLAIEKRIASYGPPNLNTLLIVVGWSNGGATAAQLSEHLHKSNQSRQIDLLVTLDPVSRLTRRPNDRSAKTWLNVYTASSGLDKLRADNIIAEAGSAWDEFNGPTLMECMKGNHGEAARMWTTVVLSSHQFKEWSEEARTILGTKLKNLEAIPSTSFESCRGK